MSVKEKPLEDADLEKGEDWHSVKEQITRDADLEKGEETSSITTPSETDKHEEPHLPITRTVTAQDWTGSDDPENPHNWPMWKKVYNTAVPSVLAFAVTFGSSVYTPGFPEVMMEFKVSSTAALLPLSLYTLASGIGPALAAPISEMYGRRLVYWISAPLSMFFTLGAGFSQTFAQLLICRFFSGAFGSPVLAVGAGTNADIWPMRYRATAVCTFLMTPFLGPAMGPLIGGFSVMKESWRWTQWNLLFVTLAGFIFSFFMSETYKKIILKKRANRLSIAKPKGGPSGLAMIKLVLTITLGRPVVMLFTEPIVIFSSLYVSFNFAVLFAFFAAFPFVFEGIYHFNLGESGLTFLGIGLGVVVATITGILIDRKLYLPLFRTADGQTKDYVAPEYRLYAAMAGSFGMPVGLFWFAWTARANVHWISPILAAVPFAWGNLSIFISSALYLVDVYGPLAGASAIAANGLLRYTFGAMFPLFTLQMFETLGIAWAGSLLGFVSIAMLPIPWVLFRWGPSLRARSAYETVKW